MVPGTFFQGEQKRCLAPFIYMGKKGAWHHFVTQLSDEFRLWIGF
jgi:hypothetical protein